jgi:RNA polymerase sigma-70 factor (ECF subfamily)
MWSRRHRDRELPNTDLLDAFDAAYDQEDDHLDEWEDRRSAMRACVENAPPKSQGLLRMRYFEGQTSREIARITRKSAAAVRMALTRIRGALAECIERHLAEVRP